MNCVTEVIAVGVRQCTEDEVIGERSWHDVRSRPAYLHEAVTRRANHVYPVTVARS